MSIWVILAYITGVPGLEVIKTVQSRVGMALHCTDQGFGLMGRLSLADLLCDLMSK